MGAASALLQAKILKLEFVSALVDRVGRKMSHATSPQGKNRMQAMHTSTGDLPLRSASSEASLMHQPSSPPKMTAKSNTSAIWRNSPEIPEAPTE